ncbi:EscU/YscU/HrcU family type III secretion system export apparatus switch protein [bacterium]|nr:EscU/YscU/HrcU family type III secretion system export apparatus switch protein [candidate division CSSED10-310 bacterium]
MADTPAGERTEQPTPRRLREARRQGNVARSRDFSTAVILSAGILGIAASRRLLGETLCDCLRDSFRLTGGELTPDLLVRHLNKTGMQVVTALLPVLITIMAVAVLVVYLQVGPLLSLTSMRPKLERLNAFKGLRSIFSMRGVIELCKATVVLVITGSVGWRVLRRAVHEVVRGGPADLGSLFMLGVKLTADLLIVLCLLFLVTGVVDLLYQNRRYLKELRMSKQEVRREMETEEGKPLIKGMRRQLHQHIVMNNMLEDVAGADVVIVNPEHIAVALSYDPGNMAAPKVVAKGREMLAGKIIARAKEHNVPVMRNVSLAHALLRMEVGDEIPEALYEAVAEVLNWVYSTR